MQAAAAAWAEVLSLSCARIALFASFVTFILAFFNSDRLRRAGAAARADGHGGRPAGGHDDDARVVRRRGARAPRACRLLSLTSRAARRVGPQAERGAGGGRARGPRRAGLLKPGGEYDAIERCVADAGGRSTSTPFAVVYGWFLRRFTRSARRARRDRRARVPWRRAAARARAVGDARSAAADVLMYLSTPVPLAYTHLLEVTVTTHVLIAMPASCRGCCGWPSPAASSSRSRTARNSAQFWRNSGATLAQFCAVISPAAPRAMYYGFMCVGKHMLAPFDAARHDAFDTANFLRSTRVASLEVPKAPSGRATPTAAPTAATATAAAATRWRWWRTPRTRSPPRASSSCWSTLRPAEEERSLRQRHPCWLVARKCQWRCGAFDDAQFVPTASRKPRRIFVSPLTARPTTSSKATTRSAAPPLFASHTRKVLSCDALASRVSPVAGSAKAVSAYLARVSLEHEQRRAARGQVPDAHGFVLRSAREAKSARRRVFENSQRLHPAVCPSSTTNASPPATGSKMRTFPSSQPQAIRNSPVAGSAKNASAHTHEPTSITTSASPPATGSKTSTLLS